MLANHRTFPNTSARHQAVEYMPDQVTGLGNTCGDANRCIENESHDQYKQRQVGGDVGIVQVHGRTQMTHSK